MMKKFHSVQEEKHYFFAKSLLSLLFGYNYQEQNSHAEWLGTCALSKIDCATLEAAMTLTDLSTAIKHRVTRQQSIHAPSGHT